LRLDVPVPARRDLPAGDLGHRAEHAGARAAGVAAAGCAGRARPAAGGWAQSAGCRAFRAGTLGLRAMVDTARPWLDRSGALPAPAHLLPPPALDRRDRAGLRCRPLVRQRGRRVEPPAQAVALGGGRAGNLSAAAAVQRLWRRALGQRRARGPDADELLQHHQVSAVAAVPRADAGNLAPAAGMAPTPRAGRIDPPAGGVRRGPDVFLSAAPVRAETAVSARRVGLGTEPGAAFRLRFGARALALLAGADRRALSAGTLVRAPQGTAPGHRLAEISVSQAVARRA